jgi:hypothetical protein
MRSKGTGAMQRFSAGGTSCVSATDGYRYTASTDCSPTRIAVPVGAGGGSLALSRQGFGGHGPRRGQRNAQNCDGKGQAGAVKSGRRNDEYQPKGHRARRASAGVGARRVVLTQAANQPGLKTGNASERGGITGAK